MLRSTKGSHEAAQQAIALIEDLQGWSSEPCARYRVIDGLPVKLDPKSNLKKKVSGRAKTMELTTGQISAERLGIEIAAPLIQIASSWQELHSELLLNGFTYELRRGGAVIFVGVIPIKASSVDRFASLPKLVKRLGPFQLRYPMVDCDAYDLELQRRRKTYSRTPYWNDYQVQTQGFQLNKTLENFDDDVARLPDSRVDVLKNEEVDLQTGNNESPRKS